MMVPNVALQIPCCRVQDALGRPRDIDFLFELDMASAHEGQGVKDDSPPANVKGECAWGESDWLCRGKQALAMS